MQYLDQEGALKCGQLPVINDNDIAFDMQAFDR
jgi:hypothetical protein